MQHLTRTVASNIHAEHAASTPQITQLHDMLRPDARIVKSCLISFRFQTAKRLKKRAWRCAGHLSVRIMQASCLATASCWQQPCTRVEGNSHEERIAIALAFMIHMPVLHAEVGPVRLLHPRPWQTQMLQLTTRLFSTLACALAVYWLCSKPPAVAAGSPCAHATAAALLCGCGICH